MLPYLESDYAQLFFKHENNQLDEGEFIIILQEEQQAKQETGDFATGMLPEIVDSVTGLNNPPAARQYFLQEKRKSIR